ncbi:sulfite exporter TauE/SafE family protein [Pigmentiphaga soli]|uniref:Probable membrane transporter protein n=1 Tax=Pigmentiphaga soli TaxID=1007095 RepID=A0ABP8HAD4_9BURK
MTAYLFVLGVGLAAGALSGVIGTGASIMLLPVLVLQFGPRQAVPIMAIAGLMSNIGKVLAWRREIDWKAFSAYSVTGVPAAAVGARGLLVLPSHAVDIVLGAFFLAMIPCRRRLAAMDARLAPWQLAVAGGLIGLLTGIVTSTGPLSVPAFASYGLVKGAFLSTEAASSLAMGLSKAATFRELGLLPYPSIVQGLVVGASVMAGTFAGKAVVRRMSVALFQHVLDALFLCAGVAMLYAAWSD